MRRPKYIEFVDWRILGLSNGEVFGQAGGVIKDAYPTHLFTVFEPHNPENDVSE